jgi:hypothetical protein
VVLAGRRCRREPDPVPIEFEIDMDRLTVMGHPESLSEAQTLVERSGTLDVVAEKDDFRGTEHIAEHRHSLAAGIPSEQRAVARRTLLNRACRWTTVLSGVT